MNQELLKPTILSVQQFGSKISVELPYSDATLQEVFAMFETLVMAMGYHSKSWEQVICEKADKIRED